ncbi:hypothetical protein POM88_045120 [Heracleum sosnowskyi]|uniref:Uncharacterized protein n=1 Tax=Heracleum sosnowskyi TaxID=360622 RepID=A0AAD8M4M9_9APIA|nr:hypothetical protein POM88_045120 [Heracleum sosnowskyi]
MGIYRLIHKSNEIQSNFGDYLVRVVIEVLYDIGVVYIYHTKFTWCSIEVHVTLYTLSMISNYSGNSSSNKQKFGAVARGCILADEKGIEKTVQGVGVCHNHHVRIIINDHGRRTRLAFVAFSGTRRLISNATFSQAGMNAINSAFRRHITNMNRENIIFH